MELDPKIYNLYKQWLPQETLLSVITIDHYLRITKNFFAFLRATRLLRLNDVDTDVIIQFTHFSAAKKRYAPAFITLRLAALNCFFSWAYAKGFSRENPLLSYKRAQIKPKPLTVKEKSQPHEATIILQSSEQDQLYSYNTGTDFLEIRNKAIAILILASALFVEEVITLSVDDVDLNNQRIHIRGDGQRKRKAVINVRGIKACKAWLKARKKFLAGNYSPLLFFTQQLTPLTRRNLYQMVSDYISCAGVYPKRSGPEILRQTAICNMVNDYMIDDVKEYTGIKTLGQLEKYRALSRE